jgi:8-oxo-dGTP pyrophosphatase MutT (NUDIX family)
MHRERLLSDLREYALRWPGEAAVSTRFMAFVEAHPDCFERRLPVGHVTGSAWVVNAAGTHVLLTHHRKLDRWLQLGGHTDGEPDVLQSALREVFEESGLRCVQPLGSAIFDIDIHPIPARGIEPEHFHYDVRYAMRATGDEDLVVSDESHDLAWVPLGRITGYTTEASMLRMFSKWRASR